MNGEDVLVVAKAVPSQLVPVYFCVLNPVLLPPIMSAASYCAVRLTVPGPIGPIVVMVQKLLTTLLAITPELPSEGCSPEVHLMPIVPSVAGALNANDTGA